LWRVTLDKMPALALAALMSLLVLQSLESINLIPLVQFDTEESEAEVK
jgi:hypothetical protein